MVLLGILSSSVFAVEKTPRPRKSTFNLRDPNTEKIQLTTAKLPHCHKSRKNSFVGSCFKYNRSSIPGSTEIITIYESGGKCGSSINIISKIHMSKNQSVKMRKKNLLSKEGVKNFIYPNSDFQQDKSDECKEFSSRDKDTVSQIFTQNENNGKEFSFCQNLERS